MPLVDLDFRHNVARVRPYLGLLLIGSITLGFALIIHSALSDFSRTFAATPGSFGSEGSLALKKRGAVYYGDTIEYSSSFVRYSETESVPFITTVCFQDDTMVFHKTAPVNASVYLYDLLEGGYEWDGKDAECIATLMYREGIGEATQVGVAATSFFEVRARSY